MSGIGSIAAALSARRADSFPPRWDDLISLYGLAKNASRIVELGVGCSTVALAMGLRDKGSGSLTTIDASADWLEAAERCIPEDAKPFVTLCESPVKQTVCFHELCHRYEHLPLGEVDLVFVDGPDPKDVPGWKGKVMAADPLLLTLSKGARVVFDGRRKNLAFFLTRIARPFTVAQGPTLTTVTLDAETTHAHAA